MSQKPQVDQHRSAAPEIAAEIVASASSPIVMITSASEGVYVADHRLTRWEKVSELARIEQP
jgi:hypothetical protein